MKDLTPVITGVGVVSSAGIGTEAFWDGIQSAKNHFREISLFDPAGIPNRFGSEIGNWVPGFDSLNENQLLESRINEFAVTAQKEAVDQAGCKPSQVDRVLVGTTAGDVTTREAAIRASGHCEPIQAMNLQVDMGLRKAVAFSRPDLPVELFLTACSAGNLAVIRACQLIEAGEADLVVAGGAEAFSQMAFVGFARIRGMALNRCRPFSEKRDGMLLGEGAAFLVVESASHAADRGAEVLAEVVGVGMSCDANHPTAPDPSGDGIARAIRSALRDRPASDVDFVCAHGTGTPQNDVAEANGYAKVFGDGRPPVSSLKGSIGHSLGAASAIELVACVLALQRQRLVPQLGIDDQSTLDLAVVSDPAPTGDIDLVLNNAFAFWGNNTSIALAKPCPSSRRMATPAIETRPEVFLSQATVIADKPTFDINNPEFGFVQEMRADELERYDRRFRSRRSALVAASVERWLETASPEVLPKPERRGLVLGTETGAGADIERFLAESIGRGDAIVNPGLFPWTVHNSAVGAAAIVAKCLGPNIVLSAGAQSGDAAVLQAVALLESGAADLMFCGVYECKSANSGTVVAITALATQRKYLGSSYLGSKNNFELKPADGLLGWAKSFAVCESIEMEGVL